MEAPQISGKVFRFLSTMHPSLSKAERKKYSDFDPERWYPWTAEIAGEFTDLMKRSPRDNSFARGLAYTAQKGLPDDAKLTPAELVRGLPTLPAAFQDGGGTGFHVQMEGGGHATVRYTGMPGFTNACIAIAGEITQRLQAIGARGLEVKHAAGCRLQGADACNFEVRWAAEAGEEASPAPRPAQPAAAARMQAGSAPRESAAAVAAAPRPESPAATMAARAEQARPQVAPSRPAEPMRPAAAARPAPQAAPVRPAPAASPASSGDAGGSAQDLFEQLRSKLLEAEQQSTRHADLEQRIADLEAELEAVREQAAADVEQAHADARAAADALVALKRQIRSLLGD